MRLELVASDQVKAGMWIEGHPGWWKITEVRVGKDGWSISWKQTSLHPIHGHQEVKDFKGLYPLGCLELVGVED